METFGSVMSLAWNLFSTDMTLYGFTFSYKDAFIWSIVAVAMLLFIKYMIFD